MRLSKPLLQLPICFDGDKLAAEVNALPASAWLPHPTGFAGNEAVPLVAPERQARGRLEGAMGPTEHLGRCPYIMDMLAELDSVWGRSGRWGSLPAPTYRSTSMCIILAHPRPPPYSGDYQSRGTLHLQRRNGEHEGRRVLGVQFLLAPHRAKHRAGTPGAPGARHRWRGASLGLGRGGHGRGKTRAVER